MKPHDDTQQSDRSIDESLRRAFSPPPHGELAKIASRALAPHSVRSVTKRKLWPLAALGAAAAILLLLRAFSGPTSPQQDAELSARWMERWREMSASQEEFMACTIMEAPLGLLAAARSQLGLHLESEALAEAFAPEMRSQKLDREQGVQLVVADHAYLFFAGPEPLFPDLAPLEDADLRVSSRSFSDITLFEVTGSSAPKILPSLRFVGRDPR